MNFDQIVPHNGYAWWYVDALSDDGENGITIIAFIGSVFSPYYAFARRRGLMVVGICPGRRRRILQNCVMGACGLMMAAGRLP